MNTSTSPPSPPTCTRCANCCNLTNTSYIHDRLPTLRERGAEPTWDRYLDSVYGEPLPSSAFPLDLRTFHWFYHAQLPPPAVQPAWIPPACHSAYGHAWTGPAGCGEHGHFLPESQPPLRAAGFFLQHHRPPGPDGSSSSPPRRPMRNHSWYEVMRTAMSRKTTEMPGSWYWAARGSGIWVNVGKTYVDADTGRGEAYWFFSHGGPRVVQLAAQGYDSLQFPRLAGTRTYTGGPVNNDRFELVMLHSSHWLRGACADQLRAGWAHSRSCSCLNAPGVINCRGEPGNATSANSR